MKVLQAILPKLDSLDDSSTMQQAMAAEEGRMAETASSAVEASGRNPLKILRSLQSKLDSLDRVSVSDLTLTFKGGRIRFDMSSVPGPDLPAYGILQADTLFYMMPSVSRMMVVSLADLHGNVRRVGAQLVATDTAQPTVTDLGARSIRGVPAHGYRLLWPTRASEIWVESSGMLPELPLDQLQAAMGARQPAWAKALPDGARFPLEQTMVVRAAAARAGAWMVSRTRRDQPVRQPVADSLFVLPEGLERVPMPDLPSLAP